MSRLTYREAGVDIVAADRLVDGIRKLAAKTLSPDVLSGVGLFAAAMRLPRGLRDPVILTATDGVGTKLAVARLVGRHDTIGIDLVAMNVNDLLTTGARPLCFLDYLAVGRLSTVPALDVVRGIAAGCQLAGTSLVGGETAEMPGFYRDGEYDLAGFAVGVAERRRLVNGSRVRAGDVIVGIRSSGLHSNGYSLARRALRATSARSLSRRLPDLGKTLGEALLEPTLIYVRPVAAALARFRIHAMAHVTGGGLAGNLARVLPKGCVAEIDRARLPVLPLFEIIRREGRVARREMDRTFNCGVGFVLVVPPKESDALIGFLQRRKFGASVIGNVVAGRGGVRYVSRAAEARA